MNQRKRIFWSGLRYRKVGLSVSIVILISLLLLGSGEAQAQGGLTLSNGSVVAGTVTDQAPLVLYNFTGKTGDLISLQVIGTTPGMNPTLSLMNPSRQQIAGNNSDPYSPVGLTGARISFLLPADGNYTVLVGGTNGDFLLRFGSRQAGPATGLTLNGPAVTNFLPGAAPQLYVLTANPGDGITLSFSTTSAGFSFAAQVFDGTGQLVGIVGGTTVQTESLTICANTSMYEVLVGAAHPQMQGAVSVLATADRSGICQGAGNQTAAGAPTLVPMGSTAQPPANVCSATSVKDFDVNLRRGPSTFFGIAGQLGPRASVVISGRSADNNWYVTQQNGANIWVAANVVALNGPCGNMPVVQSPPPPFTFTPPPTATPIIIIITSTRRRPTSTPNGGTSTPFLVTQTPIIITQTPVVITATPVPPSATPVPPTLTPTP